MKEIFIRSGDSGDLYLNPDEDRTLVIETMWPNGHFVMTRVNIKIKPKSPEEPKKLFGFIACPHCGYVYLPEKEIHSVVTKVQPDTIFKPFDQKYSAVYYDAWDCPRCGGQFVGSERAPRCK